MNNWKKYALVAMMMAAAVIAYSSNSPQNVPSDFRDAPRDTALDTLKETGPAGVTEAVKFPAVPKIAKGYVAKKDSSASGPTKPVEWVSISGGEFLMGADRGDTLPIHDVDIKTFDMSKTEVTVEQYAECVIEGVCTEPVSGTGDYCNWGKPGRQLYPINCVDWEQAQLYARFKGARLPSEAEWEYAATSAGRHQLYPWGKDEPTCDKAVYGNGDCGKKDTMPVCSKTAGNTVQGLCDMAGNLWEWVQDTYRYGYYTTPSDGSAFEGAGGERVRRGCSFACNSMYLQANERGAAIPRARSIDTGFRLAR